LGTEERRGTTFRSSTDEILGHLFGITKLDYKNQCIRGKMGAENTVKEIIPGKVATTRTEDGHK